MEASTSGKRPNPAENPTPTLYLMTKTFVPIRVKVLFRRPTGSVTNRYPLGRLKTAPPIGPPSAKVGPIQRGRIAYTRTSPDGLKPTERPLEKEYSTSHLENCRSCPVKSQAHYIHHKSQRSCLGLALELEKLVLKNQRCYPVLGDEHPI